MGERLVGLHFDDIIVWSDDDDASPSGAARPSVPPPDPSHAAPTAPPPSTEGGGQGVGSVGEGGVRDGGAARVGQSFASLFPWSDDEADPAPAQGPSSSGTSSSQAAPTAPPPSTEGGGQGVGSVAVLPYGDGRYAEAGEEALSALPANAPRLIADGEGGFRLAEGNELARVVPSSFALYVASPVQWWVQRIGPRMVEAVDHVEGFGGRVQWHLPPTLGHSISLWTTDHIRSTLAQGSVCAFKIGITQQLGIRWSRFPDGYLHEGWHRMHVCAVSDDKYEIKRCEELVIDQFRIRLRRGGVYLPRVIDGRTVCGHHHCRNINRGGEGGEHGSPPHCCYVVFCFRPAA